MLVTIVHYGKAHFAVGDGALVFLILASIQCTMSLTKKYV